MPKLRLTGLILLALLISSCSIEVTGMQSPLAHDYGEIAWRPLRAPVDQRVLIAPGYTAAVANDARSDPLTLLRRLGNLPSDILSSPLQRLTIGLRPPDRLETTRPAPTVEILGPFYPDGPIDSANAPVLARYNTADLPREDDRLIIKDLPELAAGQLIIVRLTPAPNQLVPWEYAITPRRKPYGGNMASIAGTELNGALVFSTVFIQDPDYHRIVSQTWERISSHAGGDWLFLVIWIGGLGLVVGIGVYRWRSVAGRS